MKKIFRRMVLLFLLFTAVAAGVFWKLNRTEKTDMINMESATLPVIYMMAGNERINCLHGYKDSMDAASMRDTITPLEEDRNLTIQVDTYGNSITFISYEIRSLDQARLIERTEVSDWETYDTYIEVTLEIENLIEEDEEYTMVLHLMTEAHPMINYYTRIIDGTEQISDKLSYVLDFSKRTFDKEEAEELVKYLESGSQGDNTNFGAVDIYSSFSQITWGDLEVTQLSKPQAAILEINDNVTCMELSYRVEAKNMYGTKEQYDIVEFFRTRYTEERTFLLTYKRTMSQAFLPVSENINGSRINLGIQPDTQVKMVSGAKGDITCFVSNGELWYYRSGLNTMRCIFSFYDSADDGVRSSYKKHNIEIVKTQENGDVYFLVHGYMNRGLHEGKVGLILYRYIYEENIAEELFYIPYQKSADYLKENLGKLFTITGESIIHFLLEGNYYAMDFISHEYITQITGLKEGYYVISPSGNILAWQEGEDHYFAKEIHVLLLDENREFTIYAKEGENLQVIGFIDEDLAYGTARDEEIRKTATGQTECYMSYLTIMDKEERQVGSYHKEGYYFTEAEITADNMITLKRYQKTEEGEYKKAEEEYITNNDSANTKSLTASQIATELKKKELGINLISSVGTHTLKTGYIEKIQSRGEGNLVLSFESDPMFLYYVYIRGKLFMASDNLREAICLAWDEAGVILGEDGGYIWKRNNTLDTINLSGISVTVSEKDTLNLCLEAMLRSKGILTDTVPLTSAGESALEILEEQTGSRGLDLTGCSLRQILYFIQTGKPVLGKLEDGYVLIIGYDPYNAVILNPLTNTTYRIGLSDGTEAFEKEGNQFVAMGE